MKPHDEAQPLCTALTTYILLQVPPDAHIQIYEQLQSIIDCYRTFGEQGSTAKHSTQNREVT